MTVYHLEMLEPGALRPSGSERRVELESVDPPRGPLSARFYREVGAPWSWKGKAGWTAEEWEDYVRGEGIATVLIRHEGEVVGYAEWKNVSGDVEITNFGLLPGHIGQGLGGAALTEVVRVLWTSPEVSRVWLHTCERDHPNALNNYERRGFRLFRTEVEDDA